MPSLQAAAVRPKRADQHTRSTAYRSTAASRTRRIQRGGKHTGQFGYDDVLRIAQAARGDDPYGYRSEFLQLVRAAKTASAMQPLRP
jgi:Ca-activated chloride channel family protein